MAASEAARGEGQGRHGRQRASYAGEGRCRNCCRGKLLSRLPSVILLLHCKSPGGLLCWLLGLESGRLQLSLLLCCLLLVSLRKLLACVCNQT